MASIWRPAVRVRVTLHRGHPAWWTRTPIGLSPERPSLFQLPSAYNPYMSTEKKPIVAITMGDPAGIGPEVSAKALMDPGVHQRCTPVVIGSAQAMEAAHRLVGSPRSVHAAHSLEEATERQGGVSVLDPQGLEIEGLIQGQVSAEAGKASVEWVLTAGELAREGQVQAIVTAPINKEACRLAGYEDIGHMEVFQRQTGAENVATMLMTDGLRVVHMTTHRSLRRACDFITRENVLSKLLLTYQSFKGWGFPSPRIGVAALNPHASDGGLIGDEEELQIAPAVQAARERGILAEGPVPADTVFNQAIDGVFDVVLAMYHDQGHIAIKVHNWEKSISVNLGLPFIRTSVDHGTAFDIAGKGIADHQSMLEAIRVAVDLAGGQGLNASNP